MLGPGEQREPKRLLQRRDMLVLGATGGIGGEVANVLARRGWNVRALHRDPTQAARRASWLRGIIWARGDAMRPDDVIAASRGAELIVHAVNPPGYRKWGELVLPMLASSIAAARASGAQILLPGTIYNYGPDAFPVLAEHSPQHPGTRKGMIRAEMERRLRAAAETAGVRTLIVRAGDFFGPHAGNSWFTQGLLRPGRPVHSITYPGMPGIGHAWAYLPDIAEAMVRLIERDAARDAFEMFHFAGHWDEDGTAMTTAIRRVAGDPGLRIRRFPWPLLAAASPFVPLFREIWEMRHLWQEPVRARQHASSCRARHRATDTARGRRARHIVGAGMSRSSEQPIGNRACLRSHTRGSAQRERSSLGKHPP